MSSHETTGKTLTVAILLALICSVLVSASAVALRPKQALNQVLERQRNVLLAAGIYEENTSIEQQFSRVVPFMVDMQAGGTLPPENIDDYFKNYNRSLMSLKTAIELEKEQDIAGIWRIPKWILAYAVLDDQKNLSTLILPIYGKGLWSTLYGFLALEADTTTVRGLTFYQHAETPGLGGEVDNPRWKAQWKGKQIYDETGAVRITVLKGASDPEKPEAIHQIDGLSGASITTRGVDNLVKFWVGANGFGPFLENVRKGRIDLWQN